ncbi:MAG TPA: adenylate/guanylate cyclase domain-containing protein [Rhizomicrobium sp.]|nr:adenylate/guanylate cyclase domain-containing protein [Rhizomicrobium sp.]
MQRKLTAILSADMVRFSGQMEADEAGTLERLKVFRSRIFDPHVAIHGGRLFKLMGDGALVEFPSVVDAVECALAIQEAAEDAAADAPPEQRVQFRIGLNLGDVIIDGEDIYGDGVNVAARIQALAPVGGVALSRAVRDQAAGKASCTFEDAGEQALKNIKAPVQIFYARRPAPKPGVVSPAAPAPKLSICVLPFANMSGDAEQEYFSDGISEDIITDLSKASALLVVARNTAFQFKGKSVDVPQVARQLRVGHVLEGSVRKAGGRVRITAQLIDGATGAHIWAERYDRDLNDIFAVQDEIAGAIVKALKVKLLPDEESAIAKRGTDNADAYNLFLMARQLYMSGDQGDPKWAETIIRLSRRAIELDPNYADAWAHLGLGQVALRWTHGPHGESGLAAAERALALDPLLAHGHAVKARVFTDAGRDAEAMREIETALRLGPGSWLVNYTAGLVYFNARRSRDAIGYFEKGVELSETDFNSPTFLLACYTNAGDKDASNRAARLVLRHAEKVLESNQNSAHAIALKGLAYAALGEKERAHECRERALLLDPDNLVVRLNVANGLASYEKDPNGAVDALAPTFATITQSWLSFVEGSVFLSPLRDHPRFRALIQDAETRLSGGRKNAPG